MKINEPIRIGQVELWMDNVYLDAAPIPTIAVVSRAGDGTATRLNETDRLALIEALLDPSCWPMRFELANHNPAPAGGPPTAQSGAPGVDISAPAGATKREEGVA